jgi:hypothetical protein
MASHDDPSERYLAFHVTFLGGQAIVEPGLSMPGWKVLLNAPLIIQRDDDGPTRFRLEVLGGERGWRSYPDVFPGGSRMNPE